MSAAMGWSARAGVCLVVAAALTGCAGVTRSGGDYRLKAQKTATDLTAVVGSAQLAGRQFLDGRLPQSYADDVISRAEQDGSSIQSAFDTRQPPDSAADQLRDRLDEPMQQINSDLTDLRVAVRMDDHAGLRSTLADLAETLGKLGTVPGLS